MWDFNGLLDVHFQGPLTMEVSHASRDRVIAAAEEMYD